MCVCMRERAGRETGRQGVTFATAWICTHTHTHSYASRSRIPCGFGMLTDILKGFAELVSHDLINNILAVKVHGL